MQRLLMPSLAFAAYCVLASAHVGESFAGILLPQQVSFDADDIDRFLSDDSSQASAGTSPSPSRRHSPDWPADNSDAPSNPLELANSMPTGSSSSSTSTTSSPGGAIGSGVVLCALNSTLTLHDESPLGTLAEDHGFSLPDPPGIDLLRPPRHA